MKINVRDRELIIDIVREKIIESNEKKCPDKKLRSEAQKMLVDKFKKEIQVFVDANKTINKAEEKLEKTYDKLMDKALKMDKNISRGYGGNRKHVTEVSDFYHDGLEEYFTDKVRKSYGIKEMPSRHTIEKEILMASAGDLESVIEKLVDKFGK